MHPTVPEEPMPVVEARIPGAEVRVPGHPDAPIELRGELDLFGLRLLREVLDGRPGRPVRVDLSGVAFLDACCARELMARSLPPGPGVVLCDPSPQAERSLLACGRGLPGNRAFGIKNTNNGGSEWTLLG